MNGTLARALARRAVATGGFVYCTFGLDGAVKRVAFDCESDERIKALALFVVCSMEEHHRECMRLDGAALGDNYRADDYRDHGDDDSDGDSDSDMEVAEPEGLREALDTLRRLLTDETGTHLERRDVDAAVAMAGFSARRSGCIPLGDGGYATVLVAVAPDLPRAPAPTPARSAALTAVGCS